jgi:hypothetical protein
MLEVVTISSPNRNKYPNNFVNITVDNDLSDGKTIVIPNTYFPYIFEFANLAEAEGKRYISSWLRDKLESEYSTPLGKVLFTLEKELSVFPYITLDYQSLINQINIERNNTTENLRGETVTEFEFYGAELPESDSVTPEYILTWLDAPTKDATGIPIPDMPHLLDYTYFPVKEIIVEGRNVNKLDFFENEYIIDIIHDVTIPIPSSAEDDYNKYISANNLDTGKFARDKVYDRIQEANKNATLPSLISKAENLNKVIGGISSFKNTLNKVKNAAAIVGAAALLVKQIKKPTLIDLKKLIVKKKEKENQKDVALRSKRRKTKDKKKNRTSPGEPYSSKLSLDAQKLKNAQVSPTALSAAAASTLNTWETKSAQLIPTNKVVYTYLSSTTGDVIIVTVNNNIGKPNFTKTFSVTTYNMESAVEAVKNTMDTFGDIVDGEFYPTTGTSV